MHTRRENPMLRRSASAPPRCKILTTPLLI